MDIQDSSAIPGREGGGPEEGNHGKHCSLLDTALGPGINFSTGLELKLALHPNSSQVQSSSPESWFCSSLEMVT